MIASARPIIIQKYGGSSLARPEQIRDIAKSIARDRAAQAVIVVVSAMGRETDRLVELAYSVSASPNRRELDMLLTTGERVSMALMSMALNDAGCPAVSFTGSQAGVMTDGSHSNARVIDVRPTRIEAELATGRCVVIAGFQGVSPETKEITTLGRGGSDVTAVALAAHFSASRCEILKDVAGVYSADPREIPSARLLPLLTGKAALEITFWGAKVLHYRCVELAHVLNIPIVVRLAHPLDGTAHTQTLIANSNRREGSQMYEQSRVLSVNSLKDVRWIRAAATDAASALARFATALESRALPWPQLIDGEPRGETEWAFLCAAPSETLDAIGKLEGLTVEPERLAAVAATCQGAYASDLTLRIANALHARSIATRKLLFGAMTVTAIVASGDRLEAELGLHTLSEAERSA